MASDSTSAKNEKLTVGRLCRIVDTVPYEEWPRLFVLDRLWISPPFLEDDELDVDEGVTLAGFALLFLTGKWRERGNRTVFTANAGEFIVAVFDDDSYDASIPEYRSLSTCNANCIVKALEMELGLRESD